MKLAKHHVTELTPIITIIIMSENVPNEPKFSH